MIEATSCYPNILDRYLHTGELPPSSGEGAMNIRGTLTKKKDKGVHHKRKRTAKAVPTPITPLPNFSADAAVPQVRVPFTDLTQSPDKWAQGPKPPMNSSNLKLKFVIANSKAPTAEKTGSTVTVTSKPAKPLPPKPLVTPTIPKPPSTSGLHNYRIPRKKMPENNTPTNYNWRQPAATRSNLREEIRRRTARTARLRIFIQEEEEDIRRLRQFQKQMN